MNNKNRLILIILCFITSVIYSEEVKTQLMNISFTGYIPAGENLQMDNGLHFTSVSLKKYQRSKWGQRIGGFIALSMSSTELIDENNTYLYSGLFAGLFIGQELQLWRVSFGINLLLGAGGSNSNLRTSPRHIDYFCELNIETGLMVIDNMYVSLYTGFQSIGNLFPQLPTTDYLMYYPVWGITISW